MHREADELAGVSMREVRRSICGTAAESEDNPLQGVAGHVAVQANVDHCMGGVDQGVPTPP